MSQPEEINDQNGSQPQEARQDQTTETKAPRKLRFRLKDKRAVYLLPNMITMTSMFFGFLSIIWSVQGRFTDACFALLVSALMDGLDGKVARLTHSASEFGVQFDSLADLIAFGVAPAVLVWQWQLQALGRLGVAIAFIYAACGALRLARFNVSAAVISKKFFIGLPIPAASCTLVCFVFFAQLFAQAMPTLTLVLTVIVTLCAGLLMVSRVRYFSFKEYDIFRAHPYRVLVSFIVLLALLYSAPSIVGFVYCALYILSGLIYTLIILPKRNAALLLHTDE